MSSTMKRRSPRLSSPPMKEIDMEDTMMIQRTDSNETPLQMSEGSWSEDDDHNDDNHDDHNDDNHDDNHVNVISKNSKNSKNNKNEVDIVEVNPYLEKIRQKREFNQQKLHALGLNDFNKNLKRKKQKLKDERKKRRLESKSSSSSSSSSSRVPTRRSARKANKPALYTGEELETLDLTKSERAKSAKSATGTSKKIKRRKFDLDDQISKEKRMLYLDVPHEEWLQDLRFYFKEIQGNSDSNVQRVTTVVQKLMLGYGIRHPATGAYFKKNVKILLSDDFKQMLDEASEWVYNNGGDRGNGWLIEHPVKKCFLYQQARAEKGPAFLRK